MKLYKFITKGLILVTSGLTTINFVFYNGLLLPLFGLVLTLVLVALLILLEVWEAKEGGE